MQDYESEGRTPWPMHDCPGMGRHHSHHHEPEEQPKSSRRMDLDDWLDLAEGGDPRDMLRMVNRAIAEVMLNGQSYMIGSRKLTKADLKTLYQFRNALMAEVSAMNGNSVTIAVSKRR